MDELTIQNIANGAAIELFQHELERLIRNIGDPNTSPTARRSITLKVTFAPYEDRTGATTQVTCESKLAGTEPAKGRVFIAGGQHAFPHDPKQAQLFAQPAAGGGAAQ